MSSMVATVRIIRQETTVKAPLADFWRAWYSSKSAQWDEIFPGGFLKVIHKLGTDQVCG